MSYINKLNSEQAQIVIIGATGKTGRRVSERLTEMNIAHRSASRCGETKFDWEDRSTWRPALSGTKAAYITYFPDLAVPQAPADISDFCEIAKEEGLEKVVLLSGRGEPAAQHCEDIVKSSGLDWSIVRASWFNQNFLEGAFYPMIASGVIALPVDDVKEPFVDVDDIADVVVASLTESGHDGKLYEVTGPRLLSFRDIAEEISKIEGVDVQFIKVSIQEFTDTMRSEGAPEDVIAMLTFLFTEVLDGRNEYLMHGIQECLNRAPKDVADYFRESYAKLETNVA